ncbi:flagellar export protein FliJ [Marinomonas sp. CT5]|uniref:flagellar export protein FliJ n=1 Tax=Marinomonas sp. CT5 TaxID=2066133 RepID=UPI0017939CDB|nr:flagellar export protein FliJ [Marinomonas sp. CT5]NVK72494.1 flagellar export protein FliJ [Oceanospirillaceae bacterium]QUX96845.1 flagellar export protein FliJ [Marinomonas sp. CT5]
MKKSRRMQILVDLAQRKEDSAAQQLARDKAKVRHDMQKLEELREYAGQYESERNLLGLSPYLTTNYQHFVDRVQQAIVQQESAVGRSEQQADMSMRRWLQARSKTKSMDWLKEKNHKAELAIEEKQEQRQSDEFAMRRFLDNIR